MNSVLTIKSSAATCAVTIIKSLSASTYNPKETCHDYHSMISHSWKFAVTLL